MQRNPFQSDTEDEPVADSAQPLESVHAPASVTPTPPATRLPGGILRVSAWDQIDTEFVVSAMEEIQEFTAFHFLPIAQNLTSEHIRSFLECAAVKR